MNIYDELENLKARARSHPELAQALLATRGMKNPVSAFCRIAQEHGCTFSTMDRNASLHEWRRREFAAVAGRR